MRGLAQAWAWSLFAVALLAPLLANDAPLVARVGGALRFPAFGAYVGRVEPGPDPASGETWREWWARTDAFAVMPIWPYGPLMERDLDRRNEPPSPAHPLGTDDIGRDLLSRMVWGTSRAVLVGAGAVLAAALIGVPLGAFAGYLGGAADACVSLGIEVFLCFPALFLALSAAALLGSGPVAVIGVLGAVYWTSFARLVRGEFLSLRERDFVLAARGLGLSTPRVVLQHMLPQVRGPLRINAALLFASAVVVEATLAFLGLGAGESWGAIPARSKDPALRGVWHLWLFPALAVASTVWAFSAPTARRRR